MEEEILLIVVGIVVSYLLRGKHSWDTILAELAAVGFCIGICWVLNQWMPNWGTVSVVRYGRFMLLGYLPSRVVVWLRSRGS